MKRPISISFGETENVKHKKTNEKPYNPPIMPVNTTVPSIIHYIWLGSPLNTNQICRVINHVVKNSIGFKFIIWTDSYSEYYRLKAVIVDANSYADFFLRESKLYFVNNIEVRVIGEYLKEVNVRNYSAFIRESIGAYRNYAAASDILRLLILYHIGGVYLDLDAELYSKLNVSAVQSQYGFSVREVVPGRAAIQNNIIAVAPNHPWIKLMLDSIERNYSAPINENYTWSKKRSNLEYDPFSKMSVPNPFLSHCRLEQTIIITGPALLYNVLNEGGVIQYIGTMCQYFKCPDASAKWADISHVNLRDSSESPF
ncbi:Mannosyltransferase OCH1 and related enzymes [Yersinia bercovieri]|uniref:glycosyltransferase family 32 protein n=1 Tax=Yersinia bercovieri TaxID=634 RepID=UPI00061BBB5B|nr:glycosyltransferase [Yersinia bercovieri]CNE75254.1 Mannosyltransferase OCH1 and related enzymes [Yersinia bercovieri]